MLEPGMVIIPVWEYFPHRIIKQIGKHVITQILTAWQVFSQNLFSISLEYKPTSIVWQMRSLRANLLAFYSVVDSQ